MPGTPTWSTRLTFLLAAIGAAVGLGNIWKFPYITGTSGGGAFVLVYLLCVILIALPILIAELMLGRRGRGSPPSAVRHVAQGSGAHTGWALIGWLGAGAGFLIVSFYSVIAGWAMAYVLLAAQGGLAGADAATASATFADLQDSPASMTLWHSLFMMITVVIVARGLNRGIETAVRWLMPALFAMLLVMVSYAALAGDFAAGWAFLFRFDTAELDGGVILLAIGQAFFSIGVSMGLMMMYGAYLPAEAPIPGYSIIIALADTLVALLAGLAIFPLVFAHGLDPAEGPGLIFVTLPIAFGNMTMGAVMGALFFLLLVFAAVTSAIALLQPMVTRLQERLSLGVWSAAALTGGAAWLLGLASVLSFNRWADVAPLSWLPGFAERTPYEVIDYVTANVLMPLGGMLIALFAGWVVKRSILEDELPSLSPLTFGLWRTATRVVAPLGILLVFLANLT